MLFKSFAFQVNGPNSRHFTSSTAGLNKTTPLPNPTGVNRKRPTTDFISHLIT